jgi:hypothetical protein
MCTELRGSSVSHLKCTDVVLQSLFHIIQPIQPDIVQLYYVKDGTSWAQLLSDESNDHEDDEDNQPDGNICRNSDSSSV